MDTYRDIEDQPIDPDLVQQLRQNLAPGEQLLWIGQSIPTGQISGTIFAVVCAVLLIALGVFLSLIELGFPAAWPRHPLQWLLAWPTLIFTLFGAALLFLVWKVMRRGGKILYAVTTKRALTARFDLPGGPIGSVMPGEFAKMRVTENTKRADGSGSMWFGQPLPFNLPAAPGSASLSLKDTDLASGAAPPAQRTQTDFLDIPKVREVEAVLRKLAQSIAISEQ